MSCDIAFFYKIACTVETINLCTVNASGTYSVKLTHTGNGKDYWFESPTGETITIDVSEFAFDVDLPYKFSVYNLATGQGVRTRFGEVGATAFAYEVGVFSFAPSETAGETLPTTATLELI